MFAIQDDITATVAGKLAVRIDDTRLEKARGRSTDKLPVYDCWLRGMECLKRGTLEDDEEARTFFAQALEIDSRYARACAGLSLSHFNEWTCNTFHLWDESESNALDYAIQAAELDNTDAMYKPCWRVSLVTVTSMSGLTSTQSGRWLSIQTMRTC